MNLTHQKLGLAENTDLTEIKVQQIVPLQQLFTVVYLYEFYPLHRPWILRHKDLLFIAF